MNIKTGNYKTLTEKAVEVYPDDNLDELLSNMWELLNKHKGCGLAANQVGVLKRVIIISTPNFTGEIINPALSDGRFTKSSIEGCLSFPGFRKTIKRYNRITVSGFDRNWNPITLKLKSLSAFCAQHEVDHLDGITLHNKSDKT